MNGKEKWAKEERYLPKIMSRANHQPELAPKVSPSTNSVEGECDGL